MRLKKKKKKRNSFLFSLQYRWTSQWNTSMFIISQTATYAIVTTSIAQTSFYFKSIQSGNIKKKKKNLHFVNRTGEICNYNFKKKKKKKGREKRRKKGENTKWGILKCKSSWSSLIFQEAFHADKVVHILSNIKAPFFASPLDSWNNCALRKYASKGSS